jgi:hypothetical protein
MSVVSYGMSTAKYRKWRNEKAKSAFEKQQLRAANQREAQVGAMARTIRDIVAAMPDGKMKAEGHHILLCKLTLEGVFGYKLPYFKNPERKDSRKGRRKKEQGDRQRLLQDALQRAIQQSLIVSDTDLETGRICLQVPDEHRKTATSSPTPTLIVVRTDVDEPDGIYRLTDHHQYLLRRWGEVA